MQNPPPGPPPGQQPQMQPAPAARSGMDKKTAATLSYLLWWLTGLIFLFVGKDDPDVKFHAAQSIIFFGAITVLRILLGIIGTFTLAGVMFFLSTILLLIGVIYWIIALYKSWTGNGARFELPLVGGVVTPYAEQLAAAVK
jgi:uncharacterized membrane protein